MKRKLQMMLLLCVAFLCMPMTVKADGIVAKIGETGYSTLQGAVDAVADGQTIVLQKDVTLNETLIIKNKSFIINGNGKSITGTCSLILDLEEANLSLNGVVANVLAHGVAVHNSNLTLNDSEITVTDPKSDVNMTAYAIEIKDFGIVNLNNSTLKAINSDKKSGFGVWDSSADSNSKIFINGASTITGFAGGIVANSAIVTMTDGEISNNGTGVQYGNEFTMTGGKIHDNATGVVSAYMGTKVFNMQGGSIYNNDTGFENHGDFSMTGGEIKENHGSGILNLSYVKGMSTVKLTGGDIQNNSKWGVENHFETITDDEKYNAVTCTRDMFDNHMSGNKSGKVSPEEFITFIDDPVPTPNPSEGESGNANQGSNFEEPVMITDSEGNIVKEPEMWVPTTPDEIKRYAFLGREAVKYSCPETNAYGIKLMNAMQGPKCFVSFEAVLGDYTMGRTYNAYVNGKLLYAMDTKATITLNIPKDLQKEGRTFKMICVTEGGLPIVLNDLDKNPETITFETDRFYAFALIYK